MRIVLVAITLGVIVLIGYALDLFFTSLNLAHAAVEKADPSLGNAFSYNNIQSPFSLYNILIYSVTFMIAIMVLLIIGNALRRREMLQ